MAPGVLQLRTACCSIVVPIRLALCIPLLICIFDGYSDGSTLQRTGTIPIISDTPQQAEGSFASTTDLDATDGIAPTARLLTVYTVIPSTSCPGRALAIAFTILAIAFSLSSMIVTWFYHEDAFIDEFSFDDLDDGHDHKTAAAARRATGQMSKHKWRVWNLSVGMATRLLLAALGTTAFVRLLAEQERIKPGSFAAIEGLGWTVVCVVLCLLAFDCVLTVRKCDALPRIVPSCLRSSVRPGAPP
ncbi:hypothetical protein EWM64_g2947 [Hericium alpestre]|uniref:Uncharacterized protein n=1 Tax=Hericium alpestre TaxID=135208 RepID=A0A4Z0A1W6_9AGAM|nr:hypothetical protein EWM64_g2947 [Hericium alpestre]